MLIPVHNNIPRCYRFSFVRPVIYRTLDSYNQQSTFLDSVAADEDVKIPQPQLTERSCQSEGCACANQREPPSLSQRFSSLPHLMAEGDHSSTINSSLSQTSRDGNAQFLSAPTVCCSHHRPLGIIMEENIRMRQAINDMLLTLTRWMRQNNEQAEQVKSLLGTLQESDRQRNVMLQELEALKLEMKSRETDWAAERENRLQADRDKERAKQMILKLQEENWGLRKARSIVLISRGPNVNPGNDFSIRPSVSRFDSPD